MVVRWLKLKDMSFLLRRRLRKLLARMRIEFLCWRLKQGNTIIPSVLQHALGHIIKHHQLPAPITWPAIMVLDLRLR